LGRGLRSGQGSGRRELAGRIKTGMSERIQRQLQFILEADRAKSVLRQNRIADASRDENIAEHMWHAMLMAVVLAEHSAREVDLARVVSMLLVHDIVEIDAGDVIAFDTVARAGKADRERAAAERIFGLLPDDQARTMRLLWEEFERAESPEARYAKAIDAFSAILVTHASSGSAWSRHAIHRDEVIDVHGSIADCTPAIWDRVLELVENAVKEGWLRA
jgi:putative hydrolase of HD superfamily